MTPQMVIMSVKYITPTVRSPAISTISSCHVIGFLSPSVIFSIFSPRRYCARVIRNSIIANRADVNTVCTASEIYPVDPPIYPARSA